MFALLANRFGLFNHHGSGGVQLNLHHLYTNPLKAAVAPCTNYDLCHWGNPPLQHLSHIPQL